MHHYLLSAAVAAFSFTSMAQNTVNWGPEIAVADGSVYGNTRPRLVLTSENTPVVIFGKSATGDLYVSRWNGAAFASPVQVSPAGLPTYLANWTGPGIAAHGDTVVAVFKAQPIESGKIFAVRSVDGGLTFSDTIRVDDHTTGRVFLPSVTMDDAGNPVVSYMAFTGMSQEPHYKIAQSQDAGISFSASVEASSVNTGEACDCCPSEIAANGQDRILLYRNNNQNMRDIFGARSTDNGQTFTSGGNLEYLFWNVNSCPSTGPHGLFKGDSLITVSASKASGNYRVYASVASLSPTMSFVHQAQPEPPANVSGSQNYPRISGENDTIIMVWEEKETSNPEIFCSVITDGNVQRFSDYKARVNTVVSGVQTNPDVIYRDGYFHVVFQDAASGDVIYRRGTIADVIGIEETGHGKISVSPNPSADGNFILSGLPENVVLTLTDVSGKAVDFLQTTVNGDTMICPEEVPSGVYILRAETTFGVSEYRLVKSHR